VVSLGFSSRIMAGVFKHDHGYIRSHQFHLLPEDFSRPSRRDRQDGMVNLV